MAIKLHTSFALHPLPWLRRNFIEPYGVTQSDAAKRLAAAISPVDAWPRAPAQQPQASGECLHRSCANSQR